MPLNTLRVLTEYVLVKSGGPKVLWAVAAETEGAGVEETRGHGTTPLRGKEYIEDVSSELDNGGSRLQFLDETSRTIALDELGSKKTSSRFMTTIKGVKEKIT
ncbi:hypothetical protein TNCV_1744541 [Trichonephila clavipes]|nr:hypothetical protein TNCV_1744541 [Trichonephila clavipes]